MAADDREEVALWIADLFAGARAWIPRGSDAATLSIEGVGPVAFRDSGDRMPNGVRCFVGEARPQKTWRDRAIENPML